MDAGWVDVVRVCACMCRSDVFYVYAYLSMHHMYVGIASP